MRWCRGSMNPPESLFVTSTKLSRSIVQKYFTRVAEFGGRSYSELHARACRYFDKRVGKSVMIPSSNSLSVLRTQNNT